MVGRAFSSLFEPLVRNKLVVGAVTTEVPLERLSPKKVFVDRGDNRVRVNGLWVNLPSLGGDILRGVDRGG